MAVRTDPGVLDRFLRAEIMIAHGEIPTVITFNQDLIVENCVYRLPRRGGQWCLTALYDDGNFIPVFTAGHNPAFKHHDQTCPHRPPVTILKLHGSLNWNLETSRPIPTIAEVFPEAPVTAVYLQQRRQTVPGVRLKSKDARRRGRRYLWPLIVPPIYDKQRIVGMDVLQAMWDRASGAIMVAERIVLFGYSLPASDILARQLMRRAYGANPQRPPIDVINPDTQLGPKLQDLLDCRVVRSYRAIADFVI
jgi:hypothetical protein